MYKRQARDRIGFILEAMPFIQEYTLEENAGFFGPLYSVWDMDTFRRCLKRYDLSPDTVSYTHLGSRNGEINKAKVPKHGGPSSFAYPVCAI